MQQVAQRIASAYGLPVTATVASLALTLLFRAFFAPSVYLVFIGGVTVSAWFGGRRAGLIATALSLICIVLFLLPPLSPLNLTDPSDVFRLLLFATVAVTISIISDVRLREIAARQQLDTELRFRALVEAAPDAILVIDPAGQIVLVNSGAEQLYGYTRSEMVGQSIDMLLPEHRRAASRAHRTQLFASPQPVRMGSSLDLAGQRRDGSAFPVEISFSPVATPEGPLLIAAVRDITEHRRTQDQILRQQQQLADAQQIALLGSWEWEVATDRVGWSAELRRIYGVTEDGFDSSYLGFLERVHPDDRDMVDGIIRHGFEQRGRFQFEHRIVRPNGEVRILHARGEVILDDAGQVVRMVGTGQDITERKEADGEHERLVREQAALAASEQNQRRLLFLTEASAILSSSLEYEQTLPRIAELTVPLLADWCVVHVLEEGDVVLPVGIAHRDPQLTAAAHELLERNPVELAQPAGIAQAIRSGTTQFFPEITLETLTAQGYGPEYTATIDRLGLHACLIVPLLARGRTLGALSLLLAEPGRHFTPDDRLLAETLARRAALAVDNALLYRSEQQARRVAEEAQEQLRRHATALQALADASHDFSAAVPDFQRLLDTIARQIGEATGDLSALRLLSDDGERLLPGAAWYHDPEIEQATRDLLEATQDINRGQWRDLLQKGMGGVYGANGQPPQEPTPEQAAFARRYRPQSTFVAPLNARGRLLGGLSLTRFDRDRPFTEAEIALVRDLAERAALAIDNARLYRETEDQRQRLYTALEQLPHGITLVEAPDGHVSFRNTAARQFGEWLGGTGPTSNIHASYDAARYFDPDGTPIPLEKMPALRVLQTGETVHSAEIICEVDGQRLTILTSAAPIKDALGKVTSVVVVFEDISERKTLEQQKDEFLSLAAHELKTPLTVVKGNSQLLQRLLARGTVTPEQLHQYLQRIEQRVRYMEDLISELLDLSRIVTGRLEFHPEAMDLAELVRHVVAQQRDLHPETPYTIEGAAMAVAGEWDRGRIEQVLTNLLDNAAKYSSAGDPVAVTLTVSDQEVGIAVRDSGIGIPAADLPHIFERHYRAHNVDRGHSGLGLGLYLSSQIVQRHGGRLWAESAVGHGSTFRLALPLPPPEGGE